MGFIVGFILLLFLGLILAFPLAAVVIGVRKKAKRQAGEILKSGVAANRKEFDRISKILSAMTNDLEAIDLWKKLQDMKGKD